jgi:hypothetical protein
MLIRRKCVQTIFLRKKESRRLQMMIYTILSTFSEFIFHEENKHSYGTLKYHFLLSNCSHGMFTSRFSLVVFQPQTLLLQAENKTREE